MKRILPILCIIMAVVAFFPSIFFSHHTFISSGVISTDLYLFNYPLKSLMHKFLLRGLGLPFWTDVIGNGYPIFAEGQMGESYPLHFLLFRLPFKTITLFNANLMLHYILTGIFTYLYIKISIKLSQKASVLGALIFAFSGYMLTHLHQVNIILELTYFPLNLLIIETILHLRESKEYIKKVGLFIAFTLILYLQITAGHIEMVYYNLLFAGIYVVIRFFLTAAVREAPIMKLLLVGSSVIIACLMALPQLYATYELVNFSQRESGISYETTTGTLWPVETLILFINPKAYDVYRAEPGYSPNKAETVNIGALYPYIGILPLFLTALAIIAPIRKQKNNSQHNLWTVTFVVLLLFTYFYAVGRSTQLFSVIWELIPGMKFFRFPIKAIYIIEFCLAVLASIGLQNLEEYLANKGLSRDTKNTQKSEITSKKINNEISSEKSVLGNYAGIISLANILPMVIIGICFIDLRVFNAPTQPTIPADNWLSTPEFAQYINSRDSDCHCDDQQNKYPITAADNQQAPRFQNWRSYSHGTNNIDYTRIFDFSLQKDLQNILHIDFNMIHDISLNREWAVLFLQRQTALNRFNTKVNVEEGTLALPPELKKSLDLQSVRYLISDLPLVDQNLELVKSYSFSSKVDHVLFMANSIDSTKIPTQKAYLYENKSYFPRITITSQRAAAYLHSDDKNGKNILEKVLSPEFNPTAQTIIEKERQLSQSSPSGNFIANYKVLAYNPQSITVQVETSEPAYFSIADTYYPGWKAWVDHKETTIERANYAFKAVAVPAGQHLITLSFQPTHWQQTMTAALIGWSIVTTTGIFLSISYVKSKYGRTTPGNSRNN